jgi:hypothetical protein
MSTQTSAAAVLTEYKQPLELRRYPVPQKIGPKEALVRVEMAGICGTDVHLWLGELPIPLPVILGHETVGRIDHLGSELHAGLAWPAPFRRRSSNVGKLHLLWRMLLLPFEAAADEVPGAQGLRDLVQCE